MNYCENIVKIFLQQILVYNIFITNFSLQYIIIIIIIIIITIK